MTFKGVDVGEMNELAADLLHGGLITAIKGHAVVERGAFNVMTTARKLAPHGPHTPRYAQSITYDVEVELAAIVAEIGPDKDKDELQGDLGNLLEFGTSELPGQAHIGPAVDIESPNFYAWVGAISAEALW